MTFLLKIDLDICTCTIDVIEDYSKSLDQPQCSIVTAIVGIAKKQEELLYKDWSKLKYRNIQ